MLVLQTYLMTILGLTESLDIKIVYEGRQREAGRRGLFREALAAPSLQ